MFHRKYFALGSIVALGLLSSCSQQKTAPALSAAVAPAKTDAKSEKKLAPDFTLNDANGAKVNLADYRGKVVLLNFWATWCGPCELEIPWFVQFEQQFKSQGFEVVGVSMDDDGWNAVKPFIASHKMNYRVLLGNDSVSQLYGGIDSLPTTFILNREGKMAFPPHVGLAARSEYLNEIQSLLTSSAARSSRADSGSLPAIFAAAFPSPAK